MAVHCALQHRTLYGKIERDPAAALLLELSQCFLVHCLTEAAGRGRACLTGISHNKSREGGIHIRRMLFRIATANRFPRLRRTQAGSALLQERESVQHQNQRLEHSLFQADVR